MPKKSAGLLLFRRGADDIEVLLVHPGGPFWAKKDDGAWSIPKGEFADDEDALSAAKREFEEETGWKAGAGNRDDDSEFIELEPVRQPGGKIVYAWALNDDHDCSTLRSNLFSIEWPPRSGRQQEFPEVDKAAWFAIDVAMRKILKGQVGLLEQLRQLMSDKL